MQDSPYMAIPPTFHSVEYDGPFAHCQVCREHLVQERLMYAIEKIYRGEEVILEHAICLACMEKMHETYSRESREAMEAYQQELDLTMAGERFQATGRVDDCLHRCVVTGTRREELRSYHIFALCHGADLFILQPPFLLSEAAVEEMQELLSAETRGEIDRYTRDHLNTFPDLDKILGGPRPLFV